MDDWQMKLAGLEDRLAAWNRAYDRELKRLLRERGLSGFLRSPSAAELEVVAQDVRQRIGDAMLDEAYVFLDELSEHFLAVGPQERGLIRARVGAAPALFGFLWSFIVQRAELLEATGDELHLRRGLAALAVDDGRADHAQVVNMIARFWLAAEKHGIAPEAHFERTAKVANPGASGGGSFLRAELAAPADNPRLRDRLAAARRARSA